MGTTLTNIADAHTPLQNLATLGGRGNVMIVPCFHCQPETAAVGCFVRLSPLKTSAAIRLARQLRCTAHRARN